MALNEQQKRVVLALASAVIHAVKEFPDGVPQSFVYIAMQKHGATYDQYLQITGALVETGYLEKRDQKFYATSRDSVPRN
jgi:hypothetical protein